MLVVHPSSTCDVCLERYAWDSAPSTPHSISCGHIFCRQCLESLSPRTCPLCRRLFHIERVRKLHVDLAADDPAYLQSSTEIEVRQLEERIAGVSVEGSSDDDCRAVIEEVIGWLETRPSDAHSVLREFVGLLHRYKMLKENLNSARDERDKYRRKLKLSERDCAQDKLLVQGLQESLDTRIAEVHREYNKKLDAAEAERQRLEVELARYITPSKNPLPAPPEPVPLSRLPAYAYPNPRRNGAPHGYIPESSALSAPSLPPPPKSPDWRDMSLVGYFPQTRDSAAAPVKEVVVPPRPGYMGRRETSAGSALSVVERVSSSEHRHRNYGRHESASSGMGADAAATPGAALGLTVDEVTPRPFHAPLRRATEPIPVPALPARPMLSGIAPAPMSSQESVASSRYMSRQNQRNSATSLSSLIGFEFLSPPTSAGGDNVAAGDGRERVQEQISGGQGVNQTQRRQLLDQLLDDSLQGTAPMLYSPSTVAVYRRPSERLVEGREQSPSHRHADRPRTNSTSAFSSTPASSSGDHIGSMFPFPSQDRRSSHVYPVSQTPVWRQPHTSAQLQGPVSQPQTQTESQTAAPHRDPYSAFHSPTDSQTAAPHRNPSAFHSHMDSQTAAPHRDPYSGFHSPTDSQTAAPHRNPYSAFHSPTDSQPQAQVEIQAAASRRNPYSSSYSRTDPQTQAGPIQEHELNPRSQARFRSQSSTAAEGVPYIQAVSYPGGYASPSALGNWSRTAETAVPNPMQ